MRGTITGVLGTHTKTTTAMAAKAAEACSTAFNVASTMPTKHPENGVAPACRQQLQQRADDEHVTGARRAPSSSLQQVVERSPACALAATAAKQRQESREDMPGGRRNHVQQRHQVLWLVIHCNVNHDLKRPEHLGVRAAALKHAFEISERYCMNEVCSMIRGNGRSALERERAHLLQLVLVGNMVEPSFAARGTIDVHDRG